MGNLKIEVEQHIDKDLNLRVQSVSGLVILEDLLEYLKKVYSSPDFDPSLNVIWDFRDADLRQFNLTKVVNVRDYIERGLRKPKPRKAALVVLSQMDYSLTSMFQTLMNSPKVKSKVFFDFSEAKRWICMPRD